MLRAFILAKDEESNISRSVGALRALDVDVVVLDSGSSDRTREYAEAAGASVEEYEYRTHERCYEELCSQRTAAEEHVLVIDADMIVNSDLLAEALTLARMGACVVRAPIRMCWRGTSLKYGSLCPPKPFLFRGGNHYFQPAGHGERLRGEVPVATTCAELLHDDRKSYDAFLNAQARYARGLLERSRAGKLTLRDRVRLRTPLMILATPLTSYVLCGGVLDGRAGIGYALDRLIAEAVMFREALAMSVE